MNCAALHRSMGINVSFVRSLSMDTWSEKQLRLMALGGNKALRDFY
jgi:ADP-ribosylation factor GTPase-activating protein 2/3